MVHLTLAASATIVIIECVKNDSGYAKVMTTIFSGTPPVARVASSTPHWLTDAPDVCSLRRQVLDHPLMTGVGTIGELRGFMEQHVYAVWDFMSLLKALQGFLAPASWPWMPPGNSLCARLINEIVLAEETDRGVQNVDAPFPSHFQVYLQAMKEIQADTRTVQGFLTTVQSAGWVSGLAEHDIPAAARRFMDTTFSLLMHEPAYCWAAVFVVGREDLVPQMFSRIQPALGLSASRAPAFHHYLLRHIQLDGDAHGPMARSLADAMCGEDLTCRARAVSAAAKALRARLDLWNGIFECAERSKHLSNPVAAAPPRMKPIGTAPSLCSTQYQT